MEDVFNKEKAMTHTMNDLSLLKELVGFTLEDVPVMLENLKKELKGDVDAAAELAHKVKGSAGAIRAEKLFAAAFELETTLKEGDLSRAEELYLFVCESFKELTDDEEVRSVME